MLSPITEVAVIVRVKDKTPLFGVLDVLELILKLGGGDFFFFLSSHSFHEWSSCSSIPLNPTLKVIFGAKGSECGYLRQFRDHRPKKKKNATQPATINVKDLTPSALKQRC